MTEKNKCDCGLCNNYRQYKEVYNALEKESHKSFLYDLYDKYNMGSAHIEYEEMVNRAYRIKYGDMTLDQACKIINKHKTKQDKQ